MNLNGEERELVLLLIPRLGTGPSICFGCSGSIVTPLAHLARRNHRNDGHFVPYCLQKTAPGFFLGLALEEQLIVPVRINGIFLFLNKLEFSLEHVAINLFLETHAI